MAMATTAAAILFFWKTAPMTRASGEGTIGLLYVASAALAVVIIWRNPGIESQHGINLVSGNLLYCTLPDLVGMTAVVVLLGAVHALFRKEFLFVAFDYETASAQGLRAGTWDLLLMLTIGVGISFCMKVTGVLFVFASLVIPGMTGLALSRRVNRVFVTSMVVACAGVFLGLWASLELDVPSAPAIICVYALCFCLVRTFRALRS
jgi:ABC-type Mn2+/Zn2+ transport system permease subunit